jgi:hypothetical protein
MALTRRNTDLLRIRTIEDLENAPRLENGAYNLVGANLEGANLQGANLTGADLGGVDLGGVDLQNANLQGSNLQGANLDVTNLEAANLQGANLQGAFLRIANLEAANLQGANLQDAILQEAHIQDANLEDSNLQGANLQDANLTGANLEGANLEGANLEGANLHGANLEGAILEGAILEGDPEPDFDPDRAPADAPEPLGIAFGIHNAFNRIDLNKVNNFFRSNIENGNQRLREFNGMNSTQFKTYLRDNMNNLLNALSPEELTSLPTMPDGYYPRYIRNWREVWNTIFETRIRPTEFRQEIQTIICLSILFAQNQGVNFQKNYILSYLNDVAFAYPIGNADIHIGFENYVSCTKGSIERFVMSLNVASQTALTDPEVSEEIKTQYRRLKNILSGGVIDSRIVMELVTSWQNENKNIITEKIGENNEFRSNKDELVEQQKQALIQYLCCQLGLTVQELMSPENSSIQDTITYIFSDDNILDNTLGGRRKRTRKYKKKIIKHRKTKRLVKTKIKRKMKKKTMKKKK